MTDYNHDNRKSDAPSEIIDGGDEGVILTSDGGVDTDEQADSSGEQRRGPYTRLHGPDGMPQAGERAVQVDVHVSARTWGRICAAAGASIAKGVEPSVAYWDAVYQYVDVVPNLIVDEESMGVEHIVGDDDPDLATDGGEDRLARKHELMSSVTGYVDVELPREAWDLAREEAAEDRLTPYLMDFVALEYRFTVEGEEVHRTRGYDQDE